MKLLFTALFIVSFFNTNAQTSKPFEVIRSGNYQIPVYDFDGLKPLLETQNDSVFVINLWATWCVPCVEELPEFIKLDHDYRNTPVKVVLVSLDMRTKIASSLIPFLEKRNITTRIVVLSDPDMNRWIPLIDKNWEGTIPATLIYSKNKRQFYPHPLTFDELETEVKKFFKP
jgi:thiol-disulfide isomerase/thioredoxin